MPSHRGPCSRRCEQAGVRSIEHGFLLDDATAAMIAERDAWWSLQPMLDDEDAIQFSEQAKRAKLRQVIAGTDQAYRLAKKHGVRLAWGTDTLFDGGLAARQGAQLAKMTRWFTPAEVLKMATSDNAALCAMSGQRDPYPGRLGVVEKGALADLLRRRQPARRPPAARPPGPNPARDHEERNDLQAAHD